MIHSLIFSQTLARAFNPEKSWTMQHTANVLKIYHLLPGVSQPANQPKSHQTVILQAVTP